MPSLVGSEMCIRDSSGTVREMSEWVEYLTRSGTSPMVELRRSNGREEPWRVPFWGLGNEPWGGGGRMRRDVHRPGAAVRAVLQEPRRQRAPPDRRRGLRGRLRAHLPTPHGGP